MHVSDVPNTCRGLGQVVTIFRNRDEARPARLRHRCKNRRNPPRSRYCRSGHAIMRKLSRQGPGDTEAEESVVGEIRANRKRQGGPQDERRR